MTEIILATSNRGKVKELSAFAKALVDKEDLELRLKTINEIYNGDFNPEETGSTFAENALIKAQAAVTLIDGSELVRRSIANTDALILADDSGIEIEALDGRPGIYAARYFKEHGLAGVLKELDTNPNRQARFVCHITLVNLNGEVVFETEQYWHGTITHQARGNNGFGYDPIVVPNEYINENKTVAELDDKVKNTISHRAKAFSLVVEFLESRISLSKN